MKLAYISHPNKAPDQDAICILFAFRMREHNIGNSRYVREFLFKPNMLSWFL